METRSRVVSSQGKGEGFDLTVGQNEGGLSIFWFCFLAFFGGGTVVWKNCDEGYINPFKNLQNYTIKKANFTLHKF